MREVGAAVVEKHGRMVEGVQGREVVVDLVPPHGRAMVRVYTSLARGASVARASGEDAVRLVVGVEQPEGFRALEDGQKVLRTAPLREADRVGAFLRRLRAELRTAYSRAFYSPTCRLCGSAMRHVVLKDRPVHLPQREFYSCIRYPTCNATWPVAPVHTLL